VGSGQLFMNATMKPLCVVGVCSDYYELVELLRTAISMRDVPLEVLEETCGMAKGHISALLKQKPRKRMSGVLTAMTMVQALGCKFIMVEDEKQAVRMAKRMRGRRKKRLQRVGDTCARIRARQSENPSRKQWAGNSEWGRTMQLRRTTLLTPQFLKRMAHDAVRKRWAKHRKAAP
jgi:hypothetical protein